MYENKNTRNKTKYASGLTTSFDLRIPAKSIRRFLGDDSSGYQSDLQKVFEKLQDIEDLIEMIAREIARQAKGNR